MKCDQIQPLLTSYQLGDLTSVQASEVDDHLSTCEDCRALLQEIEPTLDLLRDALAVPTPAPKALSGEHRLRIRETLLRKSGKLVPWVFREQRRLTAVAAVLLVSGFLYIVSIPMRRLKRAASVDKSRVYPSSEVRVMEPASGETAGVPVRYRNGREGDLTWAEGVVMMPPALLEDSGEPQHLVDQIEELHAVIAKRDETIDKRGSEIDDLVTQLDESMEHMRTLSGGGGTVLGAVSSAAKEDDKEGKANADALEGADDEDKEVPLEVVYPKPLFMGTPKSIKSDNLEPAARPLPPTRPPVAEPVLKPAPDKPGSATVNGDTIALWRFEDGSVARTYDTDVQYAGKADAEALETRLTVQSGTTVILGGAVSTSDDYKQRAADNEKAPSVSGINAWRRTDTGVRLTMESEAKGAGGKQINAMKVQIRAPRKKSVLRDYRGGGAGTDMSTLPVNGRENRLTYGATPVQTKTGKDDKMVTATFEVPAGIGKKVTGVSSGLDSGGGGEVFVELSAGYEDEGRGERRADVRKWKRYSGEAKHEAEKHVREDPFLGDLPVDGNLFDRQGAVVPGKPGTDSDENSGGELLKGRSRVLELKQEVLEAQEVTKEELEAWATLDAAGKRGEELPGPPELHDEFGMTLGTEFGRAAPATPTDFSPVPAEFDAVAVVKSPLIMKSMHGSRARAEVPVGGKDRPADDGKSEREKTLNKLDQIVIPEIDFRNARLDDVVKFLQAQSKDVDKDGRGVKLSLDEGLTRWSDADKQAATGEGGVVPGADGDQQDGPRITFSARHITAKEALNIVTDVSGLGWRVDEDGKGIHVVGMHEPEGAIVVRTYDVPQELAASLGGEDAEKLKERFKDFGVHWVDGSSVAYHGSVGKLVIANTYNQLGRAEEVISSLKAAEEAETGPRFKAMGENPWVHASANAFSTFGIDVDTASYTLARNHMLRGFLPPAESVRIEEFVNFFDYAYAAPPRDTFKVYAESAPSKFGAGKHMIKIGVKGRRLGREEQRPAVLTFLIDTSGSMEKPDRIGLVKTSLKLMLDKLGPNDKVAIMKYDTRPLLVMEHTSVADKDEIIKVIDGLRCQGTTNLELAMTKAYELAEQNFAPGGENRVLLLSDGVANVGTQAADDILGACASARKQGIFSSVFGFGIGTYNDEMLEALANKGDGAYSFIDSEEEAHRVFVEDLAATLNTIATDVKIQVEFNPALVNQYRQLGYENRQLKKEQFRDDTVDAGEVGSGQAVTALYETELKVVDEKRARERIAVVRVRYRRRDTGKVEEVAHDIMPKDVAQSFEDSSARFRLAACVAEFAEQLRSSNHARGSRYPDVATVLRPVSAELNLDKRVAELLRMVSGAHAMSRGM